MADHAYAVTGAECVRNQAGEEVQLVRVRNPWGNFEWNGDWGDNSDCWTEETRAQCQMNEAKDDGSFWMDIKDMAKYFSMIHQAKLKEDYRLTGVTSANDQFSVATFNVPYDGLNMTLAVSQRSKRSFPSNSGYEYSDARIFLVKMSSPEDYKDLANAQLTYICGDKTCMSRDTYLEAENLAAGDYLVYANMDWVDESLAPKFKNYTINAYAPKDTIQLNLIEPGQITKPAILRATGLACLRAGPKDLQTSEFSGACNAKRHIFTTDFCYLFTIFENGEDSKGVSE